MSETFLLDNISVVLVRPRQAGNVGAAARAMKNMGLRRLKLVQPREALGPECAKIARRAMHLVTEAEIHPSVDEALQGEQIVIGTTSGRDRRVRRRVYDAREIAPVIAGFAASHKVSLLFGPERSGLSEEQLARCQYLASIPAHPDYPVLNLSQSVLVLSYEILSAIGGEYDRNLCLSSDGEREQMYEQAQEVLTAIGFLSRGNPGHIMRSIRRFLGAAELTTRDVHILRGIFSQMQWYVDTGCHLDSDEVVKP